MIDSYILELNNATLRIVTPGTNDYFDLNVATYKRFGIIGIIMSSSLV